jgi:predicted nucleotidyltransferase
MRLNETYRRIIRETTHEVFGGNASVKLFGSRLDDAAAGGDIDLLVELPQPEPQASLKSLQLAAKLQIQLGDQRFDILVIDPATPLQAIQRQAMKGTPL